MGSLVIFGYVWAAVQLREQRTLTRQNQSGTENEGQVWVKIAGLFIIMVTCSLVTMYLRDTVQGIKRH